jgi:tripartite-type tricarboxylate transporter receptor subunit TctC
MVLNPAVPAKTVAEFIALAKKDPGKLNYASSGPGTPYHMAGELFKAMSHTEIVHVPHKASGDMRNSVLAGNVQMMFDAITVMSQLAKAGKVRALATTGVARNPLTPDLPTVGETVPGYEATIWIGLMAPKGTPKEVVSFLNTSVNKVINLPDVKETWLKQGAIPLVKTPEEFDAFLRKDIEKWAQVVKVSGAQIGK